MKKKTTYKGFIIAEDALGFYTFFQDEWILGDGFRSPEMEHGSLDEAKMFIDCYGSEDDDAPVNSSLDSLNGSEDQVNCYVCTGDQIEQSIMCKKHNDEMDAAVAAHDVPVRAGDPFYNWNKLPALADQKDGRFFDEKTGGDVIMIAGARFTTVTHMAGSDLHSEEWMAYDAFGKYWIIRESAKAGIFIHLTFDLAYPNVKKAGKILQFVQIGAQS